MNLIRHEACDFSPSDQPGPPIEAPSIALATSAYHDHTHIRGSAVFGMQRHGFRQRGYPRAVVLSDWSVTSQRAYGVSLKDFGMGSIVPLEL